MAWTARVLPRHVIGPKSYRAVRSIGSVVDRLPDGATEVRAIGDAASVRIFRPPSLGTEPVPGLLWIHGGGYVIGTATHDDLLCRRFSRAAGCVVVSVDYRLAPDSPYPAAVDDCRSALELLRGLPEVDAEAITVGGASAGGGLAAQLVHELVRRGDRVPELSLLVYPMLDPASRAAKDEPAGMRIWDAASNAFGWDAYLRGVDDFVPVLDTVSSALPRTWLGVGTEDLFHDEGLRYEAAVRAAGVETELVVVPGAFHGFDRMAPWTRSAKGFLQSAVAAVSTVRSR